MSVSDPVDAGIPFSKGSIHWRVIRERLKTLAPLRWIFLILGIASISYGQHLIEQQYSQGKPFPQAELWNDIYKLQIVNFDNALHALPFLIGGAFLCALFALPSAWKSFLPTERFDFLSRDQFQKKQLPYVLLGGLLFIFLIVQLARHQYNSIYPILWGISIIAFTNVVWRWDKNANKNLSLNITSLDVFWIASLLILGFIINTYALADIPTSLIPDEGKFWEIAHAIAIKDLKPALFDAGVYTFPIASSIYQGWILRVFGMNLWAWRFSSVLAGVLTIIPVYLLGKEWFNRNVAIAAVVMMVANPYFISFTRLGYNNSQSLFPVTLAIYFFAFAARKGSILYLWLAGIVTGIGFYTYSAAWLALVTLGISILYLLALKRINLRQMILTFSIILLAWGVVFAPRVAYTSSGKDSDGLIYKVFETSFVNTFYAKSLYGEADLQQTAALIHFSKYDTIFYEPVIYKELLTRATVRTLLALFDPYIVREHFLVVGLAGSFSAIFFLIGLALAFRSWRQVRFGIQLIWFTAALIFLSIIAAFPPRHTHMVSVIPVLALLSGIGLSATIEALTEWMSFRWVRVKTILQKSFLTLASAGILYAGVHIYFIVMPAAYPPSFEDIASWIAWKTPPSVNLVFLNSKEKPHSVKYLVDAKLVQHQYQSSTFHEFISQVDLARNLPTIVFIEGSNKMLESKFRNISGFSVPIPYTYNDGTVVGYVVTNTIIDINPKVEQDEGIRSLAATPVAWILIPLVVVMVASGWSTLARKQTKFDHQTDLQGVQ